MKHAGKILGACCFLASCTGTIAPESGAVVPLQTGAGGTGGSGGLPTNGTAQNSNPNACVTPDVGPTPLRRLTRAQYDNTVAALLGDVSKPARTFAPDETLLGFAAGLSVSGLLVDQYLDAAGKLAAAAATNLTKLLGCDPVAMGDSCVHGFIDRFGQRAYRRPLADDERDDLRALYAENKAASGPGKSVELVVQALLGSPAFLYRIEIGAASDRPGVAKLSGYEVASRLSYFLWNGMPDEPLFAAAAAGRLDSEAGIAAEVDRMTKDTRVRATVDDFHAQWLDLEKLGGVGKDQKLYPEFNDALRTAMHDETLRFVQSVVLEGDGKLATLLQAPWSYVNQSLAAVYGVSGVTGTALTRKDLPAGQRFGLLTHPSVLSTYAKTNQSSPIHRGLFVREHLLCQTPPPPPADLITQAPDLDPNLPTRVRFAEHSSNAACVGCHELLDPVGFGFENYDAIGRWRAMDGKVPVNATGAINGTLSSDGAFSGVGELSARLAASRDVADCVVGKWFVYALGRSHANDRDRCAVDELRQAFATSGGNVRALLTAITSSDAFRYSRVDLTTKTGAL